MQAAADESKYVMDDFYLFGDLDDLDEAEDVEVPKALGDIFESIAGKISRSRHQTTNFPNSESRIFTTKFLF